MDDSAGERDWCLLLRLATPGAIGHNGVGRREPGGVISDVHEVL